MGASRVFGVLCTTAASVGVVSALGAQASTAEPELPDQLTVEQREALAGVLGGPLETSSSDNPESVDSAATSSGSRRASYYRGSVVMWSRDNVDFGYNGYKVTWTSSFQQKGRVFPNQVTNRGISRFYHTTTAHKFRALNRYGAGTVTPWGDVDVYNIDGEHHLTIHHNGAWKAKRIS